MEFQIEHLLLISRQDAETSNNAVILLPSPSNNHSYVSMFLIKTTSCEKDRAKRLQIARYRQPNSPSACYERAASLHRVHVLLVSYSRCEAQHCRIHQHTPILLSSLRLCSLSRRTCWLLLCPCYLLQYLSETLLVYVTDGRIF